MISSRFAPLRKRSDLGTANAATLPLSSRQRRLSMTSGRVLWRAPPSERVLVHSRLLGIQRLEWFWTHTPSGSQVCEPEKRLDLPELHRPIELLTATRWGSGSASNQRPKLGTTVAVPVGSIATGSEPFRNVTNDGTPSRTAPRAKSTCPETTISVETYGELTNTAIAMAPFAGLAPPSAPLEDSGGSPSVAACRVGGWRPKGCRSRPPPATPTSLRVDPPLF
jgi:hypothetical protein